MKGFQGNALVNIIIFQIIFIHSLSWSYSFIFLFFLFCFPWPQLMIGAYYLQNPFCIFIYFVVIVPSPSLHFRYGYIIFFLLLTRLLFILFSLSLNSLTFSQHLQEDGPNIYICFFFSFFLLSQNLKEYDYDFKVSIKSTCYSLLYYRVIYNLGKVPLNSQYKFSGIFLGGTDLVCLEKIRDVVKSLNPYLVTF